ncbi:MAG TPA: hypothetical protein VIC26_11150 [Marinagarivorans sp.]
MNIINVFRGKVALLVKGCDQSISEKLIELATFFYKIDKRVSLEEQKYIDELISSLDWNSTVSVESFQESCIAKINGVIENPEEKILAYLSGLMQEISELGATVKAQALAKEVSDADGEIAEDEVKYLDLVMSYE